MNKQRLYQELSIQLKGLYVNESDFIANAAQLCALLYHQIPYLNWAGFYLLIANELVLGPFQGQIACTRIAIGQGVCGQCADKQKVIIVQDVTTLDNYIACDPQTRSEIVLPVLNNNQLIGVLDLDSPNKNNFNDDDAQGLITLLKIFVASTNMTKPKK